MKAICSVDGCENNARAKTFCTKHYQRVCSHGDVNYLSRAEDGAGTIDVHGYFVTSINGIAVKGHRAVAEKALGKPLPKGAIIHHVNGNRSDNRNENLVICPDIKYHNLLHMRIRAIEAGCPANYRKCTICKQYGDPKSMKAKGITFVHRECDNERHRQRRQLKKLSKQLA